MSRTKRDHTYLKKGHLVEDPLKGKPHRAIKTKRNKQLERTAYKLIHEAGFNAPPRLMARANAGGSPIPDAWNDIPVAARAELVIR
jgi:hypothetical protein